MIPYSIHAALLLTACLLFYKLVLQKETYYRLNRVILLTCLMLAFILPLIPIPQQFSLRESAPVVTQDTSTLPISNQTAVIAMSPTIAKSAAVQPQATATKSIIPDALTIQRIIKWGLWLYWFGVAAFGANFLLQIIALLYQAYKKPVIRDGFYRIVELDDDKAPCSFGNNIFINPAKYDWETYNQILMHEKVHIQQGHSLDLLIAELMLVMQWFNPFAWMYRKEMESNLEFLTDDSLLYRHKVEAEFYQLSLLKVSVPNLSMRITTNYNQSLLKKRIVMMNAKRSNIHTIWKYFMLMPVLVILVCVLNKPVALSGPLTKQHYLTGAAIDTTRKTAKVPHTTKSKKAKAVKIADSKKLTANDDAITDIKPVTRDEPDLQKTATITPVNIKKAGAESDNDPAPATVYAMRSYGITPEYIRGFQDINYRDVSITTLQAFKSSGITPEYIQGFQDINYKDLTVRTLQAFRSSGITPAYIRGFQDINYKDISVSTLQALRSNGVTPEYIKGFQDINYKDLSIPTLQAFRSNGITPAYIRGFQDIDYKDVSVPILQALKSNGITPAYIKGFQDIDYKGLTIPVLQAFRTSGITPEYIRGFQDIDYKDVSVSALQAFRSNGITPVYIKGYQDINYRDVSISTLRTFRSNGITPEYIRGFQDIGYKSINVNDIVSLKSAGITPAYIKGFQDIGYKDLSISKLKTLKEQQ